MGEELVIDIENNHIAPDTHKREGKHGDIQCAILQKYYKGYNRVYKKIWHKREDRVCKLYEDKGKFRFVFKTKSQPKAYARQYSRDRKLFKKLSNYSV